MLLSETDWHHFCGPDGASKCLCAPYRFLLPYSYSYLSLSFFSLCQILCWFQIDSWQLSSSFSDGRAHDECLLDFGSKIFAWNFKLHLNWWLNVRINWWIQFFKTAFSHINCCTYHLPQRNFLLVCICWLFRESPSWIKRLFFLNETSWNTFVNINCFTASNTNWSTFWPFKTRLWNVYQINSLPDDILIYFNLQDPGVTCFTLDFESALIHVPALSYGVPCVLLC